MSSYELPLKTNQWADGSALDRLRVSTINMLASRCRSGPAIAVDPLAAPAASRHPGPWHAVSDQPHGRVEGILTAEPLG